MKKKKILITGGAGFIGSYLVKLVSSAYDVIVIDDLFSGKEERIQNEKITFIQKDIRELQPEDLEGIDYIVHLAAFISAPESIDNIILSHDINVNGTLQLLEAARYTKIQKCIFMSSAAVYGNVETLPYREDSQIQLLSPYAVQKYMGEQYCRQYFLHHHVPTLVLRPFNAYGIGQDPYSPYCGVITKFLYRYKQKEPLTVFGDGQHFRDFIHVEDIVSAIQQLILRPYEGFDIFNICTGMKTTINELVEMIGGESYPVERKPSIVGDPVGSVGDPSKIERKIGFKAQKRMFEELQKMKNASLN